MIPVGRGVRLEGNEEVWRETWEAGTEVGGN
jgi:hypothetical protein